LACERKEDTTMDIGEPKRTIIVEPIKDPVPRERPVAPAPPREPPAKPTPVPVR
jgi:hypothetical protein